MGTAATEPSARAAARAVRACMDEPPEPVVLVSPGRRWIAIVKPGGPERRGASATPPVVAGGAEIDPATWTPRKVLTYTELLLVDALSPTSVPRRIPLVYWPGGFSPDDRWFVFAGGTPDGVFLNAVQCETGLVRRHDACRLNLTC